MAKTGVVKRKSYSIESKVSAVKAYMDADKTSMKNGKAPVFYGAFLNSYDVSIFTQCLKRIK